MFEVEGDGKYVAGILPGCPGGGPHLSTQGHRLGLLSWTKEGSSSFFILKNFVHLSTLHPLSNELTRSPPELVQRFPPFHQYTLCLVMSDDLLMNV